MRVLLFIVLKIVEIATVVFGPHYLGMWVHSMTGAFCMHEADVPSCYPLWVIGFMAILCCVMAVAVCIAIYFIIRGLVELNWDWADDILRKIK